MKNYEFKNSVKMRRASVYYYIELYFKNIESEYKVNLDNKDYCIDMYIPELNLAIEYQSYKRTTEAMLKELNRVDELKKYLNLILITENTYNSIQKIEKLKMRKLEPINKYKEIHIIHNNEKSLKQGIETMINYINDIYNKSINDIEIDLNKDREDIKKYFYKHEKEKSFIIKSKNIYKKWNIKVNSDISIEHIKLNSNIIVTCKCPKCSREWETTVEYINIKKDNMCPYCNNKRVDRGYNDLQTSHPKVADEWHPTKNGYMRPVDVVAGSNKKVWWKHTVYKEGKKYIHEWESYIKNRALKNYGCPYCSNKKVLLGYNDLKTSHPKIAEEWHPTKNGDIRAIDVVAGSNKKVWWMCSNNHEWQATVSSRTKLYHNCPVCKLGK